MQFFCQRFFLGDFFVVVEFLNIFKPSYPIPRSLLSNEKRSHITGLIAMFKNLTFLSIRSLERAFKQNFEYDSFLIFFKTNSNSYRK